MEWEFNGIKDSAEVKISSGSRFLYASSRGDQNTISVYSRDRTDGKLSMIQLIKCEGKALRDIELDPTEKFLLAANQGTNNIVVFERNTMNGNLTQKDEMQVPIPVCIKFISTNEQCRIDFYPYIVKRWQIPWHIK